MSGRGRGKRPGSGPGRPPKYPNLNTSPPVEDFEMRSNNAITTSTTNTASSGGLVDILNQLDGNKRNEMLSLVGQYKGRAIGLNDFMMRSRELLGERLYAQLARDMSQAAAARGAGINNNNSSINASINNSSNNNSSSFIPPQSHLHQIPPQTQMNPSQFIPMPVMGFPSNIRPPPSNSAAYHSMPQIYSQAAIPILNQPISGSNNNNNNAILMVPEVDVTKMDTSSLQDVMQYSGVDLKAEAELLYREHDFGGGSGGGGATAAIGGSIYVDHRLKFDYFFNPFKFRAIVQHALQRHFFSNTLESGNTTPSNTASNTASNTTINTASNNTGAVNNLNPTKMNKPLGISEEAVHLVGIAIQKRLIGIIRRLSEISKHRVDYSRGRFKIKIENDPKKQLWLQEKLFIEGVGEEKRRITNVPSSSGNNNNNTAAPASSAMSGNQILLNPPSISAYTSLAKSVGSTSGSQITPSSSSSPSTTTATTTTASASASNPVTQANSAQATKAEDSVKTKLANVTAMAALGIRQKSWMSSATAINSPNLQSSTQKSSSNAASTSASGGTNSNDRSDEKDSDDSSHSQHPLANFYSLPSSTPLTDAELRAQYFNRTISTVDLIACMESDSHLKRSKLLAVLYEALPRENKENAPPPPPNE